MKDCSNCMLNSMNGECPDPKNPPCSVPDKFVKPEFKHEGTVTGRIIIDKDPEFQGYQSLGMQGLNLEIHEDLHRRYASVKEPKTPHCFGSDTCPECRSEDCHYRASNKEPNGRLDTPNELHQTSAQLADGRLCPVCIATVPFGAAICPSCELQLQ